MTYKIPIIIQARQGSSRLPSKVMTDFCSSYKMIEFQYLRLKSSFKDVVVATTTSQSDDQMCAYLESKGIKYFRGPLDNVMKRFVECINLFYNEEVEWFVRVGGDDPFVSIEGIAAMIDDLKIKDLPCNLGMYYNSYDSGMIYGCAAELFSLKLFKQVLALIERMPDSLAEKSLFLEHTKPSFLDKNISAELNFSACRASVPGDLRAESISLTVDYPEDFLVCSYIANLLYSVKGLDFTHLDLVDAIKNISTHLLVNSSLHSGFGE